MDRPPANVPPVLEEVRQRRVGKVVVAYLAFAFAGIEATFYLAPVLDAPDWGRRAVLGAIVLGFPVAVVLAWVYDITPKGLVRTPDDLSESPEDPASNLWIVVTVLGIVTGIVLDWMRG